MRVLMQRPRWRQLAAASALALTLGAAWQAWADTAQEGATIKVVAQRFRYTPDEIVLKRGQTSVLEIQSLDFMHGFKVPGLGIRVDLPPGTTTRVVVKPEKSGRYDFLCDNFCGEHHEDMSGRIVVVD